MEGAPATLAKVPPASVDRNTDPPPAISTTSGLPGTKPIRGYTQKSFEQTPPARDHVEPASSERQNPPVVVTNSRSLVKGDAASVVKVPVAAGRIPSGAQLDPASSVRHTT